MRDADRPAFMRAMAWLKQRFSEAYEKEFPLPDWDYFEAVKDLPLEDVEQAVRWLWGHAEFYPSVPGSLRKWVVAWREAHPRPYQPPAINRRVESDETPESRERGALELQRVLDALSRGESPRVITVSDLVGEV